METDRTIKRIFEWENVEIEHMLSLVARHFAIWVEKNGTSSQTLQQVIKFDIKHHIQSRT